MTKTCPHTHSHILDSRFHGGGYATPESRRIFCDRCRLLRWLTIEEVLARAQAEVGLIPQGVAAEIAFAVTQADRLDFDRIALEISKTGHSLVPLLRELQQLCPPGAGEYIHYGATTQDIQDTGQSLEIREVLQVLDTQLQRILTHVAKLAKTHQNSVMTGRTHAVPALPITFGLKAAGWLDELLRHRTRIQAATPRILVAQLFGGAGTMAAFGEKGLTLLTAFAQNLKLEIPDTSWHAARDRLAEFGGLMAMLTASLARIADEIRTLSRPEIGELTIGWEDGMVGSSTMPHKRNPEDCEQIVVLSRLVRTQSQLLLEAMVQDHERDYRSTRLEWVAITDISHYTLTAMALADRILRTLQVNTTRMKENADFFADSLCTEALMFALAKQLGKQSAYQVVYALSQQAQSQNLSFRKLVKTDERVKKVLNQEKIEALFQPQKYLGASTQQIAQVLQRFRESTP